MTDRDALLAAVLAAPDDDTPRLVFADWCDDSGDADRAAFIRAQVEAARAEPWSPAQREAEARAAPLLPQMVLECSQACGARYRAPEFVRGFVEGVELYPIDLPDGLADLCAANPIRGLAMATDLDAYDSADRLLNQFALPVLSAVRRLNLRPFLLAHPLVFPEVVRSPFLERLTDLSLALLLVQPLDLQVFLAGTRLPELSAFDVSGIPNLGPALAGGLGKATHRAFARLNLDGVRFLSPDLKRVLESPALAGVEDLSLGWDYRDAGPATMIDLGWLLPWAKLRRLNLAGHQLGPDGVREITDRPEARGLRWLGLARNQLGDGGARRLLESPHLRLYHLDVSGNDVSGQVLAALRTRFPEAVVVG